MARKETTKKMTTVGILCAMAMILTLMVHFPIVPAVNFLSYDPKDIVIVLGGFIYGPLVSFVMSAICSILEIFFRGGNVIDVLMNMISTCMFACVASYMYVRNHTKKGAIIGLVIGVILTTVSMTIWNYLVTPYYYGMPREVVVGFLLPGIVPFNLIKSGVNSIIIYFLYKPIVGALRKSGLVEKNSHQESTKVLWIVCAFIVISLVLALAVYFGG